MNAYLNKSKVYIRGKLLKRRSSLEISERQCKSKRILKTLSEKAYFKDAKHIACYFSVAGEVLTNGLIRKAISLKKKVYLPRVDNKKKIIDLYQVCNLAKDLKKGAFGIKEPIIGRCLKKDPAGIDLIIVPGVAFDFCGGRLGRGGGYYDKLLKRTKNAKKIGIAFKEQIVKKIPMSSKDSKVDEIIYN